MNNALDDLSNNLDVTSAFMSVVQAKLESFFPSGGSNKEITDFYGKIQQFVNSSEFQRLLLVLFQYEVTQARSRAVGELIIQLREKLVSAAAEPIK